MRRAVGTAVVLAWLAVLGWNARRELFRPASELLALGAATLPPGSAYYMLDAGSRPAGMATVIIDTLPGRTGFMVSEQFTISLPGLGAAGRSDVRQETWLDAGVAFDSLHRMIVRGGDTVRVRAYARDDSLRWESPRDTIVHALSAPGVVQTAFSWPLRYAAAGGADDDEIRRLDLLDPATGSLRSFEFSTRSRATRVFADSADTEPATGAWVVAGRDTVVAWWIEPAGGLTATSDTAGGTWVDEDGRYIETELAGGLRLRRTAFELAFYREGSPGANTIANPQREPEGNGP